MIFSEDGTTTAAVFVWIQDDLWTLQQARCLMDPLHRQKREGDRDVPEVEPVGGEI